MSGIFLIIFLLVWGAVAVLLGSLLSRLIKRLTTNTQTGAPNAWRTPLKLLLIVLVFLLPIADEIVAYPRYYQMCEAAGKYEFAPGMDVFKASEREVFISETYDYILLFPHFETLLTGSVPQQRNVKKDSGVIVEQATIRYMDATTRELVLTYKWIDPIASFFAINWNGKQITWLLRRCDNGGTTDGKPSSDFFRDLKLTISDEPINFNTTNMKAE